MGVPIFMLTKVLSVSFVTLLVIGQQGLFLAIDPVYRVFRRLRLLGPMRRHFIFWTYVAYALAYAYLSAASRGYRPDSLIEIAGATLLWLGIWLTLILTGPSLLALPGTTLRLEELVTTRWPENKVLRYLERPVDALLWRVACGALIIVAPAWALLCLPETRGLLACATLIVATVFSVGTADELTDHSHIHSNLYQPARNAPKCVVRLLNVMAFVHLWVLNPLTLRIPHYYRVQHVYLHHVENNGPEDNQTTLRYDRTSYIGFCLFSMKIGLSLLFAHDVYRYVARKGKTRLVRMLLAGQLYVFGLLVLLAQIDLGIALFVCLLRFSQGFLFAVVAYSWHGLADVDNPCEVTTNTHNGLVAGHGQFGAFCHLEHHVAPGTHWSDLQGFMTRREETNAAKGAMLFWSGMWSGMPFLCMLFAQRFDILASFVRYSPESKADGPTVEGVIRHRTRALRPVEMGRLERRLDHMLARLFNIICFRVALVARVVPPEALVHHAVQWNDRIESPSSDAMRTCE